MDNLQVLYSFAAPDKVVSCFFTSYAYYDDTDYQKVGLTLVILDEFQKPMAVANLDPIKWQLVLDGFITRDPVDVEVYRAGKPGSFMIAQQQTKEVVSRGTLSEFIGSYMRNGDKIRFNPGDLKRSFDK